VAHVRERALVDGDRLLRVALRRGERHGVAAEESAEVMDLAYQIAICLVCHGLLHKHAIGLTRLGGLEGRSPSKNSASRPLLAAEPPAADEKEGFRRGLAPPPRPAPRCPPPLVCPA